MALSVWTSESLCEFELLEMQPSIHRGRNGYTVKALHSNFLQMESYIVPRTAACGFVIERKDLKPLGLESGWHIEGSAVIF